MTYALGSQLEQLLGELTEIRKELAGIRAAQTDLSNGQTALVQALLHIKRDGVIRSEGFHRARRGRAGQGRAAVGDIRPGAAERELTGGLFATGFANGGREQTYRPPRQMLSLERGDRGICQPVKVGLASADQL